MNTIFDVIAIISVSLPLFIPVFYLINSYRNKPESSVRSVLVWAAVQSFLFPVLAFLFIAPFACELATYSENGVCAGIGWSSLVLMFTIPAQAFFLILAYFARSAKIKDHIEKKRPFMLSKIAIYLFILCIFLFSVFYLLALTGLLFESSAV